MEIPPALITALRAAGSVAALTGAGISAESGVPTFRDAQTGLWAQYRAEDLATPEAFLRDPRLVWDWYAWRRKLVSEAEPNPGHDALAEMESHLPRFTLITQNVDGLHRRAGSQNIIELHGNLQRVKCFDEGCVIDEWQEVDGDVPRCPQCGSLLRPDVVWFGEMLPTEALEAAFEVATSCDIFFSIGTSGLVQPAASLPYLAREQGVTVVEINPEATPLSPLADFVLRGPSGQVLPDLVAATWGSTSTST